MEDRTGTAVFRNDLTEHHLGVGVRVVDREADGDGKVGACRARRQHGVIDRVPRHQFMRLRREGLGLGFVLGGLGLGEKRSDPLEHRGIERRGEIDERVP